jgi:PAS domain S-box-containing protein
VRQRGLPGEYNSLHIFSKTGYFIIATHDASKIPGNAMIGNHDSPPPAGAPSPAKGTPGDEGMPPRKKLPFSHYLLISMIILMLLVAVGITYVDYIRAEKDLRDHADTLRVQTEKNLEEAVYLVDSGFKLFDTTLNSQMERYFPLVADAYEKSGRDPSRMDLQALKNDMGGSIDIYLINRSIMVEYSTFAPDIGLDFRPYPQSFDYLSRIIDQDGIYFDRVVRELSTGNLRKFAYMSSPDHRYIFELGLSREAFSEREQSLDYSGSMKKIADQNPYLTSIRMFDTTRHMIGNSSFSPDPRLVNNLNQVIQNRTDLEFIDPQTGILTRYLFVNLTDPLYASDTSWILELTYDTRGIQTELNALLAYHALVGLIAIAAAAGFAGIASRRLARPVRNIVSDIDRIAQGDLDHQVSPSLALEFEMIGQRINAMVGTLKGTIQQLQASQIALQQSESRYRAVVEHQTDMIDRWKPDGVHVLVNDAYSRVCGVPAGEIMGTRFRPDIVPEDLPRLNTYYASFTPEHPSGTIQYRIILPDGHTRWLEWNDRALFDNDRNITEYQSVGRDITDKKKFEQELIESEAKFRELVGLLPQVVFETDLEGRLVFVNQHAFEAFGYDSDILDHMNSVFEFIIPEDREKARKNFELVIRGTKVEGSEYSAARSDGTIIRTMVYATPIARENRVIGIRGILVDITKLKQVEEDIRRLNEELELRVAERTNDLEMANRELEAFSYSVSHDLRAPLRAIDGFASMLHTDYGKDLPTGAIEYLERIRSNVQHMSQLIDAILNFSRMSRQPLVTRRVYPAQVAREVFEELKPALGARSVEFTVEDMPPFDGDPALIRQVYLNLISNALKFTRSRDTAQITVGHLDDLGKNAYFVRDNGVGFDIKYADKLFKVFQRLHSPREYEGTGIGLAIVQRIIQRHGGRVWADSAIDRGATFYFTPGGA